MWNSKLSLSILTLLLAVPPFWKRLTMEQNCSSLLTLSRFEKSKDGKFQESGKEIYEDFCMQCHGANGKGDRLNFPPLDGSDWLTKKRKQSIHSVKFGQSGTIVVNNKKYNNSMPPMGLSNKEVAEVMNYIMNSWSNKTKIKVTEKEVEEVQK
jgi:mono/diheme cytochrome c family protein